MTAPISLCGSQHAYVDKDLLYKVLKFCQEGLMNFEESLEKARKDTMLNLCKEQGYVSDKCILPGTIVMLLIQKGENPCHGCNHDRKNCGGVSRKGRYG